MELYLYTLPIVLAGLLQGGYFVYTSAILNVVMLIGIIVCVMKNKKVYLAFNMNLLSIFIVCLMYFLTALWGIDSGMSLMGGVKFLLLLLWFLLIAGKKDRKERLIETLPVLGACMTLFSFVMMQFSIFEKSVSVAGRLAGFFQYPNTYALFMLICLIIAVDKLNWDKIDWLWCAYAGIAVFGIIMSGSRTVLLLMLVLGAWYCVKRKLPGKVLMMAAGGCAVLVVLLWSTGVGKEVLIRVFSTNGSTFWGRLLYMKDAAGMILTHPFGLGYYGYHYLQTSCQTGVYSVVSVHNELLQLLLDVGILPAILFYGMLVKSCISKNVSGRNRLLLLIVILHSLFDYDFQFLVIGMVVILLLEDENVKEIPISWFTRICSLFAAIGVMAVSYRTGLSDYYYMKNMPQKALKTYQGNTEARIELLKKADTVKNMKRISDKIIEENSKVAVAYSARAQVCFAGGDMEGYIKNKLIAIQIAPYQYEEYEDYLDTLAYAEGEYLKDKDTKSAQECVKRANTIPGLLNDVKEKTSSLGWKINDTPTVLLSHEKLELIKEMEKKINE